MDNPHVKHHLRAAAVLPIHPMVMIVDRITLIEAKVAKNMQYWEHGSIIYNRYIREIVRSRIQFRKDKAL